MKQSEIADQITGFKTQIEEFLPLDFAPVQEVIDYLQAQRLHYLKAIIAPHVWSPPIDQNPHRKYRVEMEVDEALMTQHQPVIIENVSDRFARYILKEGGFATDIVVLFHSDKTRSWYTMLYNISPV